jgi:hypothetical protein
MQRTYAELSSIDTFRGRFDYLALNGEVGRSTFGFDRWVNQQFYTSRQWRDLRHHIIVRDQGCDMAFPDHEIYDRVYIHHMNPMTPDDIHEGNPDILDPEFLVCVAHLTHNAIHYGDPSLLPVPWEERKANDTRLW